MALAPEIAVSRWFNTKEPLTLSGLRGRPVLLHAFQMLCPGCVAHGTPQTQRAFDLFKHSDLQVIAALLAELLDVPASRVPVLMRDGAITSVCERGVDDNEGAFRLSVFHRNRRARLSMHLTGRIIRQIDHRFRRSSDPGRPASATLPLMT